MIQFVQKSRSSLPIALIALLSLVSCKSASSPEQFLARGKQLIEKKEYNRAILELKNAARLQPKNAEVYYQAGLAYLALGDYRTAYDSLSRASELDPTHVATQNKIAELIGSGVTTTRDPQLLQEAEKRVRSVLAIVADSGEALTALGRTEYLLGRPEDAVKDLEAALGKAPQNLQAAWSLAMIKVKQKDFAGAEQILKKAVEDSPNSADAKLALARLFVGMHRPADAETAYRQALNTDPKYAPALRELAGLQLSLGKNDEAEKTLARLSALPGREYRHVHATYLFEQGRRDDAIKEFEKLASADPKDREAFTRLTAAYFIAKRFPDAERAVNGALKKNPKDMSALLERSKLYLLTAKFSEAESDLTQILKFDPNSAMAHYLISKVLAARGQQLQAREQLGRALEFDPDLLAARLDLAQSFTAEGGATTALDLLSAAPENQKNLLPVVVARNAALLALGDKVQLRKSLATNLAGFKDSPDLVLQYGLLKFQERDIAGARKSLQQVLAVRPEDVSALDALAKTYVYEKKPDQALRIVQQYAEPHPGSAPLQNLLGYWMATSGRHDLARKAYSAALAADGSLISARMGLALLDAKDGRIDSARQNLAVLAAAPATQAQAESTLGMLEDNARNPAAAISHYRKVLEVEPNNVVALNNLGYDLANSDGRIDEALQYAQKAKELDPRAWYVEDTIGWAFYQKGLYDNAVIHLRNAATKEPTAVRKYHLAMAYLKAGDRIRGRQVLDEARRMNPGLPEATAASQLIASLSGAQ